MRNDIAVFILSHGRAGNVKTLDTLKKCGYTGAVYIIVDDMDEQLSEYRYEYGSKVIVFSKKEAEKHFDTMTNQKEYRSVVYARNEAYRIAEEMGLRFILMLDDDISNLQFRMVRRNSLKGFPINNLNILLDLIADYMRKSKVSIFGFSQAGSFIGGMNGKYKNGYQRMVSQAFVVDVENRTEFRGIFNEDLHISLDGAINGKVIMSTMLVSIQSPTRTTNAGGLHDLYEASGTYVQCFYSMMAYPNCQTMQCVDGVFKLRNHNKAMYPMILSGGWKK